MKIVCATRTSLCSALRPEFFPELQTLTVTCCCARANSKTPLNSYAPICSSCPSSPSCELGCQLHSMSYPPWSIKHANRGCFLACADSVWLPTSTDTTSMCASRSSFPFELSICVSFTWTTSKHAQMLSSKRLWSHVRPNKRRHSAFHSTSSGLTVMPATRPNCCIQTAFPPCSSSFGWTELNAVSLVSYAPGLLVAFAERVPALKMLKFIVLKLDTAQEVNVALRTMREATFVRIDAMQDFDCDEPEHPTASSRFRWTN